MTPELYLKYYNADIFLISSAYFLNETLVRGYWITTKFVINALLGDDPILHINENSTKITFSPIDVGLEMATEFSRDDSRDEWL